MKIARSKDELVRMGGEISAPLAFVPTMGALHAGHLSLVDEARKHGSVAVSIFVNPTQFAPHEDFDAYPRDAESDIAQLEGVDLVYLPRVEDLYPTGAVSDVTAGEAAEGLETDFRPHFFDGVCSVVKRLFDQVQPDVAIFGEKDYQQLMVIREMVETLGMDIEIIGAPIVRDEFGLALSSRNAYLSAEELGIARQLNVILKDTASSYPSGGSERLQCALLAMAKGRLLEAGFDKIDYIEERWGRILAAAWLGKTRLIDNIQSKLL